MTNAELISKIREEIERRIKIQDDWAGRKVLPGRDLAFAVKEELKQLLSFLDTLESEKPMNQKGLEREIERCLWKLSDDPSNEELRMFARHFYDLGCRRTAEKADEIEYNRQRAEESEKPSEELEEEIKSFTEELECGTINLYHSMFGEEGNFDKFSWEDISAIIKDTANHFAKWGAEHLANSNDEIVINGHKVAYNKDKDAITMEEIPNDLEEEAVNIADELLAKPKDYALSAKADYWNGAHDGIIAGAKWQKEQDEKEQADLFTIVALDAAQRAKEQMMKEAVEGTIDYVYDEKGDAYKAIRCDWLVGDFGDKVRVIVLPKED